MTEEKNSRAECREERNIEPSVRGKVSGMLLSCHNMLPFLTSQEANAEDMWIKRERNET